MDVLFYFLVSAAVVAAIFTLLKWIRIEYDREHERQRLTARFDDVISDIRKRHDHD